MDIAAGVEAATHRAKLPGEVAEEITSRVCAAVQEAPQLERNLTAHQLKAIWKRKRQSIVVMKTDKCNATVMIDTEEYHRKCIATNLHHNEGQKIERKVLEALFPGCHDCTTTCRCVSTEHARVYYIMFATTACSASTLLLRVYMGHH